MAGYIQEAEIQVIRDVTTSEGKMFKASAKTQAETMTVVMRSAASYTTVGFFNLEHTRRHIC